MPSVCRFVRFLLAAGTTAQANSQAKKLGNGKNPLQASPSSTS